MNNKRVVIYFVKYPEPGKVKTRLAKSVGFVQAARMYRTLAEENWRMLVQNRLRLGKLVVAYDPPEQLEAIQNWLEVADAYVPQEGKDLGERLEHAFRFWFDKGCHSVIALGSDTLQLSIEEIVQGTKALISHDAVIGPARDGGYYLIGTSREHPSIFKNIPWSSTQVFESTLTRLNERNLSYYLLQKLEDLDETPRSRPGGNPERLESPPKDMADPPSFVVEKDGAKNLGGGAPYEILT